MHRLASGHNTTGTTTGSTYRVPVGSSPALGSRRCLQFCQPELVEPTLCASVRLLDLAKPFVSLLPEVEFPYQKIGFDEKIVYTVASVAVYLLASLPLSNVSQGRLADPFTWLRTPFASQAGTALEFGLLPIVTAGFLWQILAGLKIVKVSFESRTDRELFQSWQKLTAVLIAVVYSVLLTFAGYFDPVDQFTSQESVPIWGRLTYIVQLSFMALITALLVELLDKGYGFGPGILALSTAWSATQFATSFVGITTSVTSRGWESHGALVQLIRNIRNKSFGLAIYEAFTRENLANLTQIYIALAALGVAIYFGNCRVDIPIKSAKVRSMASVYPIKLLYCGALPLVFTYAVLYNLNIIGFAVTRIFNTAPFAKYIGQWKLDEFTSSTYNLTCGFLYFISASPKNISPIHLLVRPITFSLFTVIVSVLFAKSWSNISGSSGRDLAKQFKEQDISMIGHRDTAVGKELGKIIPVAATTGALIVAGVTSVAEGFGLSNGLAVGVLIGVLSALTLLESVMTEFQQSGGMGSQFGQLFQQR
ncbi:hypothetical protein OGAPHI_002361 [Ogataea philodendri]|uniref:Translocon Sec61/SecY plug domain-containing protein n=1 Tax=Ogataea philodendri TaxID=1378263 RepID=A0A9P8PC68_9ASCO|nr:uncharacterized protein OGAPHI_002361 [Ogataea philodendri]KAH3668607.1 hypothetical protein OGAPHI_002361 [Ogataea philodendri]